MKVIDQDQVSVLGVVNVTAPEQAVVKGKQKSKNSTLSKSSGIDKDLNALSQKWSE